MSEFEHEDTEEIICPWCGYQFRESWEFTAEEDETDCYRCEKPFKYHRIIDVTYDTERVES